MYVLFYNVLINVYKNQLPFIVLLQLGTIKFIFYPYVKFCFFLFLHWKKLKKKICMGPISGIRERTNSIYLALIAPCRGFGVILIFDCCIFFSVS